MRIIYFTSILNLLIIPLFAQKKPLDHSVYDEWKSVRSLLVSPDGQFILYSSVPQQGDAVLTLSTAKNELLWTLPRSEDGRFTDNSQFAVSLIKPPYAVTRQAKIKKTKEAEMPKDSLAIFSLLTNDLFKAPNVKSYKLPKASSSYIAYLEERAKTAIDTSKTGKSTEKKENKTGTLHVRNLTDGQEEIFQDVNDYYFDNAGSQLVIVRNGIDSSNNALNSGLFLYLLKEKQLKQISRGKGTYQHPTFDEGGNQLAFVAEKNPEKALQKPYNLYYYTPERDTASIIATVSSTGMPQNWNVSGEGKIRFSKNGEKLFFGIAPIPAVKDTTIVDFEVANVDIWSWKDDYLQPQQLVNLKKDLAKNYLSVIYPKRNNLLIPLGSLEVPDVHLTDDADHVYALGSTNFGKRIAAQWEGGSPQDFYLISTLDGSKKRIAENVYGRAQLSPLGQFVLWYNLATQQWNSYTTGTDKLSILNKDLPVSFADEDNDAPTFASPYGVAGWAAEDKEVFIYDKYDIWSFDPKGNDRHLLTNGAGRISEITFRYQDINTKIGTQKDKQAVIIPTRESLLLSAFNHKNKENGWYYTNPRNKRDPKEVVMGPYTYRQINADVNGKLMVYTKENYKESPDVFSTSDFKSEVKLSNINPQQQQYNWGTAELVKWTTPAGHEATGILYKPEDFDPAKKHPLIAYFYEKLSDGLHAYIPPAPTPSRLNISYFVSNGYLVFAPDIHYEIGFPGKSAEEYINSGVAELAKFPWVDEEHLGIQGQSWGGYQVAHLITRTDMYAAAWAGAPVVNMTSAYGGIRWATGLNRQFQYEKTQSRIGKDLWDGYDLYIENSPLFHLKSVNTPVVIMANDQDGAVPWYQGIEMFTALRRLGKPVWMLNYNGEEHNLVKRQNRKDIQIREQQFFDHYLKGKPAPVWLEKGVPATLKGVDWGFDLVQ